MTSKTFFPVAFLVILMIASCDNENADSQQLSGKYDIVLAERNGKVTQTLKDGVFDFGPDGQLTTNIFGQELSLAYQAKPKGQISITGMQDFVLSPMPPRGDTIVFRTKIKQMRMRFYLLPHIERDSI